MKRTLLISALLAICIGMGAQEFHSIWIIKKKTAPGGATYGKGTITATDKAFEFTIPVGSLPAGSYVEWDFSMTAKKDAPQYYAMEYFDQGRWKADGVIKCTLTASTTKEITTQLRTLRFEDPVNGDIRLRLRAVTEGVGMAHFMYSDNTAAVVCGLGTQAPRDTARVLCIGNSFTYVCGSSFMLKELAWSQGHFLDLQDAFKGGRTFGQHLRLSVTDEKIREGRYEYVFLQNQSQTNAWYWQDRKGKASLLQDGVALAGKVRKFSPCAKLIFEYTWAYPGNDNGGFSSFEDFDSLLEKGTRKMAKAAKGIVSPIGKAFAICRQERPDIDLYGNDQKHQNEYGAYLKACVNYLILFKEPFSDKAGNCSLDAEKAAYLRSLAERVVL